ncbi:MAG TPA: ammonium transporter, partial [Blastococcus sp.]|nr:ammonium transporter [Blastococcus sp.]
VAFGNDVGGGLLGNPGEFAGLQGTFGGTYLATDGGPPVDIPLVGTIPATVFVAFQAMFAIITVALISGAVADRMKFGAWLLFAGLWATIVYFPVAHWVFSFDGVTAETGGWIANQLKAIDFAGGTAVHVNAGAAGLALALVLGRRVGFAREPMRPHNLPLVMLGAGLLWFGWFGFNAGSALGANNTAAVVWVNTLVATAAAVLGWLLVEKFRDGHSTSLGAASGVVAGLVAITPACSAVSPIGAVILGAIAGGLCALAVGLKYKLGYDDSLDVVGVHLVGGLWGTIAIGFLADPDAPAGVESLIFGGSVDQLWRQVVGAVAVLVFSFVLTWIIGTVIQKTMGFRIAEEDEITGIDNVVHAESGYDFASLGSSGSTAPLAGQARAEARNSERTLA